MSNDFFVDSSPGYGNGSDPELIVDSAGVIHAMYVNFTGAGSPGYPARYGECAGNCKNPASWTFVSVGDQGPLGSDMHLALDPSGHPRIVYLYYDGNGTTTAWFASCDSGCAQNASSWSLGQIMTFSGNSYAPAHHNFTIDTNGRAHFFFAAYASLANVTTYVSCASNCTSGPSAWTVQPYDANNQRLISLVATANGGLKMMVSGGGANNNIISYRECAGSCENLANWSADQPLYFAQSHYPVRMRVDAAGQLRVSWYQGQSGEPSAAGTDDMILYGGCNSNCTNYMNWVATTIAGLSAQDGKDGVDMDIDSTDTPVITYGLHGAGGLGLALCTGNCSTTPTWSLATLETTNSVGAETPPILPVCTTSTNPTPQAFWYPGTAPSVTVAGGNVAILNQVKTLQQCLPSGSVVDGPSVVRLHMLP